MTMNKQQYFELVGDKQHLERRLEGLGEVLQQLNKEMIADSTTDAAFEDMIQKEVRIYKHRRGLMHRIDSIKDQLREARQETPKDVIREWRSEWRQLHPAQGPTPVLVSIESMEGRY